MQESELQRYLLLAIAEGTEQYTLRGDIQFPRAQNTYTRMPYILTMLTDPVNVALVFDQIESGSAGVRWFSTGLVDRALKWPYAIRPCHHKALRTCLHGSTDI